MTKSGDRLTKPYIEVCASPKECRYSRIHLKKVADYAEYADPNPPGNRKNKWLGLALMP